ncbi:hypothetical protein [Vibrio lentus]|uniref:hypothetical protein n=1 Tax=Vibrio lentus TaxID=136468 RepID=UPI000C847348|nr:hypothetical protein [Vibrio lentus]PML05964.1 hypothetical protein BCT85_04080 [Vibrio lentus]
MVQVLGLVCVLGGIALFLNGVAGTTSWSAKILGVESTITDAAPSAILFIIGLLFVFVTRYKFVHKKIQLICNLSSLSTIGIFSFSDFGREFEFIGCVVSYLIGR